MQIETILDYTSYITESGVYGLNSIDQNRNLFFFDWIYCKYCNSKIKTIFSNSIVDTKTIQEVAWHKSEKVVKCEGCKWWQHRFYSYLEGESQGFKDWQVNINSAIARKFKLDSNDVPLISLNNYLTSHNEQIHNIHHKKMEELVASVFRESYNCDIEIVGKSNDGGVDLIMINSDNPTMIQVKRRKAKNRTESVKEIRDLLGATLLKGGRNCAFVTTADHFSKEAIDASRIAISKNIVDSFELFDYKRFIELLNYHFPKYDNLAEYNNLIQLSK